MRIGARRGRAAQFRRAVAKGEIALRRAQENHGARQHELLGDRFHRGSKRDRVERLEIGCGRRRTADGARHGDHDAQYSRCHDLTPWLTAPTKCLWPPAIAAMYA